ncbi:unnamed protein product [Mytilus edulis]|uniref:Uncharacterized protein n=1 Tax=Mytilus edulis TaxID=6550 RepID=A0A8S3UQM0_MYTED|nr:unnamed protein product [Mytilus edulis]
MDQQLYAVAQQVKWSLKDKFADHIIRLGGFHALSCFIAAVGKLWSEAGLKDLLVDSGVYAGTTAEQMLSGKQFNRAVRGLTLVYEALMHVLLSQFFQCSDLEDRLADVPKHLWSRMKEANLQFESSACSGNSQPVDNLTETFTQYWGIANIAGQKSALIRWSLSRHVVADFASTMRVQSGIKSEADHMHGQTQKAVMKRDEEHVRTLINHLTERMTNPFDISLHPTCLINISTGMHVSPEIQKSLLTAIETGNKNLRSFVNNALSTDGKSSFYSPLSRSNLKIFADMSKKTPFRSRTGDTLHIHVDPELVFRRALTLSSSRSCNNVQSVSADIADDTDEIS